MRLVVLGLAIAGAACSWSTAERELLLMADGMPITAAVADDETCVEVGADGSGAAWCVPGDRDDAVWLGSTSIGDGSILVGQAPEEVVAVVLTSDEGRIVELLPEESSVGRFFIGLHLPAGDHHVVATRADGTQYVSGDVSLRRGSGSLTTITP